MDVELTELFVFVDDFYKLIDQDWNRYRLENNLKLMDILSKKTHNMEPFYILGQSINFASHIHSNYLLKEGWSIYESNGIWTVGDTARLSFRLENKPNKSLLFKLRLTPFMSNNEQKISIFINNIYICKWDFHGVSQNENFSNTREIVFQPNLIGKDNKIDLVFRILHPISPKHLQISEDKRVLGLMLHELVLCAEKLQTI